MSEQNLSNQPTRTMSGGRALAEMLKLHDAAPMFGMGGFQLLPFYDAIRDMGLQHTLINDERCGTFAADAYARVSGRPGVCDATLGPGATNLVTAAAYAQLGAMPMVMVTGQKPVKTSKQGAFQILDIVGMMKPLTKFTHQLVSGENIPNKVREAFRLAEEERPGAAHLEIPEDICEEEVLPCIPIFWNL